MKHFIVIFLCLLLSPIAEALEYTPYNEKEAEQSKLNGELFAYHFAADWCSTCLRQKNELAKLKKEPSLKDLKIYMVDFDIQKKIRDKFEVERQSTFIMFQGNEEKARSLAIVEPEKLIEFFKQGR